MKMRHRKRFRRKARGYVVYFWGDDSDSVYNQLRRPVVADDAAKLLMTGEIGIFENITYVEGKLK